MFRGDGTRTEGAPVRKTTESHGPARPAGLLITNGARLVVQLGKTRSTSKPAECRGVFKGVFRSLDVP